ncbi:MAG TPA: MFS transporter [Thermoplasmata archaeon]|nr:MFS transporter [Thermoplasmata archaeon]
MVRRELLSLSLYSLLASNRGGLFIVFLPLYLVEVKGASLPVALAILSFAYIPASLIGPLVGRLSDRVGRRRPFLLFGEAVAFPLFLAITFAPGWLLAGALFVAAEVALAIGGPAYTAYVADVTGAHERGEGYGLLNATSNAGAAVGFILAGVLTYWFGLQVLFPFVVAVMVGTLSVIVFLVPESRVTPTPRRRPLREMAPVATFSFAVSIRAIGSGAVATFYGYLAYSLGANDLEVGLVAIAGLVTGALVSLPLGRMIDRRGAIRGIWYGTALTLFSYGMFMLSTEWVETIPGQAVRNAGLSLVGPGMQVYVAELAPEGHRAEYLGFFSLINSTLWSAGPLVGAIFLQFWGYAGLFWMAIATTILSLAVMEILYGEVGIRARLIGRAPEVPLAGAGAPPLS